MKNKNLMLSVDKRNLLIVLDTDSKEEKQNKVFFRNVKVFVNKQVLDEYLKNQNFDYLYDPFGYLDEVFQFLSKIQVEKKGYKELISEADIELLSSLYPDMDKDYMKSYAVVLVDCLSIDVDKGKEIDKLDITIDLVKKMEICKEEIEESEVNDDFIDEDLLDEILEEADKYIPRQERISIAQKLMSGLNRREKESEKQKILNYMEWLLKKRVILEEDFITIKNYLSSSSEVNMDILAKILMLPIKSFSQVYTYEDIKTICKKLKSMNMNDKLVNTLCGTFVRWISGDDKSRKPISFLIHGPPGVGKSITAKVIADLLAVDLNVISMPSLSNLDLVGSNSTWSNAKQGLIADGLIKKQDDSKTTVFLIDEVDKSPEFKVNVIDQLISILDPEIEFKDIYLNINLNLGNTIIIMTANDIKNIPDYIISRTIPIEYKNPIFNKDYNSYLNQIAKILSNYVKIEDEIDKKAIEYVSEHVFKLIQREVELTSLDFRKLKSYVEYFINEFISMQIDNNYFGKDIYLREFQAYILRK